MSRKYIAEIELKRDEVESFDRYPFSLAAVRRLDRLEFHPAVTFFVGENGSGKSTLLEAVAVACGFNAEGGSKNCRFGTRTSHSEHYRVTRNFLANPRFPLDILFERQPSRIFSSGTSPLVTASKLSCSLLSQCTPTYSMVRKLSTSK